MSHIAHPASFVPDLASYDDIIVASSFGKDSIASMLVLTEMGYRPELWHHCVDGRDPAKTQHGSRPAVLPARPHRRVMDWPVTEDYGIKLAQAMGLPLYFSWREGGIEGELDRAGTPTGRVWFETPEGLSVTGGKGRINTRGLFPQVTSDLKLRWCSSVAKIDVMAVAIRNQARFNGRRVLVVSGERAEESTARARYKTFEGHRTNSLSRHVDVWRPVHGWSEAQVWKIIERHRINPHPAYRLGWGRLSCKDCIFASANQCASSRLIDPAGFGYLVAKEAGTGATIHRSLSLSQRAEKGVPYAMDPALVALAMSEEFNEPIFIDPWVLPAGAFGESAGPT